MKVLSLFDGISCGRVALERAGIEVEKYDAYEIEESAIKISQKNWPDINQKGDVFNAVYTKGEYDLLIGGSPCTYWSIAKRDRETTSSGMGFELFNQYVRALKETGCKWFLYENNQSISEAIKEEISKALGVQPIVINSKLVSAQDRKRCYWTNIPGVEAPEDMGIILQDILENGLAYRDKSHCLTASYNGAVIWNSLQRGQRTMVAVPSEKGEAVIGGKTFLSHADKKGQKITEQYNVNLPDGKYEYRKFTIKEMERLQTLPDGYTDAPGVSDGDKRKGIGNGWTVDVIAHILSYLKPIKQEENENMEKVYVCSQYGTRGNRETNLEFAKLFCGAVIEEGAIPICPHLFYGEVLNDDVESQRAAGLRIGLELLEDCSELRIYSRISEGMKGEILRAEELGIPVTIGNLAYIYSEDKAADIANEIWKEWEELQDGKEHHTEEN